jgi:hypothetical protein
VVGFALLVQAALLHTTDVLPLGYRFIHHTLSRHNLLQYRAPPPNSRDLKRPADAARLLAYSANPAVTMMRVVSTVPDRPAASAKGNPSDMPMTRSHTVAEPVKWCSLWGNGGMRVSDRSACCLR